MPPPLAAALTVLLIAYLFRRDFRKEPRPSSAVWIPILWLLIIGSRQVSQWLGIGATLQVQRLEEGSLIDQAVYGALMLAGLCVLATRRVRVGEILRSNPAIVLLIVYEGLSILWSDYPAVSFRRWVKVLGNPVMVMVLWSDPFPARAVTATLKRCGYVMIPLSVLFCKYYPSLGRAYGEFGSTGYIGVTLDKNMLGYLLFVFGMFFASALLVGLDSHRGDTVRRFDQVVNIVFLLMVGWLLSITNSKTPLLSLVVGIVVVLACRFAVVRRHFASFALATIVVVAASDALFSLTASVVEASGRDLTFTGRTELWEKLLQEPINPLIGVGYGSFWHGERLAKYWTMYPKSNLIQAHNGYIDVYLSLGLIGVCLLTWLLWTGLRRTWRRMESSRALSESNHVRVLATFGMGYTVAYLLYNVTEATFHGVSFLFVIFLILAFDYRQVSIPAGVPSIRLRAARSKGPEAARQPVERTRRYGVRTVRRGVRPVV